MKGALIFWMVFLSALNAQAQSYSAKTTNVGNIGLTITNVGTLGRPNVRNNPQGEPSMEYPLNSGIEHLFEGGLWLGATQDGVIKVSTATIDDASGYSTGKGGFEMTPRDSVSERSSVTASPNFSTQAISQQDFIVPFTDKNTIVPGTTIPIVDHQFPLGANVTLETYAWNYTFAEAFVILNYKITNTSTSAWDSAYAGIWTDLVVRNVNVTAESGSNFFNKGGIGWIDSFAAIYTFHAAPSSDDYNFAQSYGASQFLGAEWRGQFLPPQAPVNNSFGVNPTTWIYRQNWPTSDLERLDRMKNGILRFYDPTNESPANRVQLLSVGPFPEVLPNETINVVFALVAARRPSANDTTVLMENLGWARRTYLGEDRNANGALDFGEDLNGNGRIDRFVLPSPPDIPRTRVVPGQGVIDVYWAPNAESSIDPISQVQDFEGYRLYKTALGADLDPSSQSQAQRVRQWDIAGNEAGVNNGFDDIRLASPMTFPGDTVAYTYKYSFPGVLDGWQYGISVTSFDRGDTSLNLETLETSILANTKRAFPGATPGAGPVGVFPNPYSVNGAWDGTGSRNRKLYFTNLPEECEIRIYTLAGDILTQFSHNAASYNGADIQWFKAYSDPNDAVFSGGIHAWDVLSESKQEVTTGLYLFSVKDLKTGKEQQGKFAVIK